jgi:hypothetical protein
MAARVAMYGSPDSTWTTTETSTDSRTVLLDAIPLLSDAALRAKFFPLVAALFAPDAPRSAANVRAAALRACRCSATENAARVRDPRRAASPARSAPSPRVLCSAPAPAWRHRKRAVDRKHPRVRRTVPRERRTSQDFVETVQLGNDLAACSPADATRVRKTLRELGVSVFVVKTVREQMRFDVTQLVVEAGKPFEIILENVDVMPHNLVVVTPGAREEVGLAAMSLPAHARQHGRLYVPDSKKVLGASKMLEPARRSACA